MSHENIWTSAVIKELVDVSCVMLSRFPNAHFVSVGNSPSYVIYALDLLARSQGLFSRTTYVPFSTGYVTSFGLSSRGTPQLLYGIDRASKCYLDSHKYKDEYRRYLQSNLDLYPAHIFNNFEQTGQKTFAVDNLQHGISFTSFMHFMYAYASDCGIDRSAFSNAFSGIGLIGEKASRSLFGCQEMPPRICILDENFNISYCQLNINDDLRRALNGGVSSDTDRFIPHYAPDEWGNLPQECAPDNMPKIKIICAKIEKEIQRRSTQRPSGTPLARNKYQGRELMNRQPIPAPS